jgi:hypothetical protein
LLAKIISKEESYKYCEKEINAVNNKATQTKEARKKQLVLRNSYKPSLRLKEKGIFDAKDPYYFLRKYLPPELVFWRPEAITSTGGIGETLSSIGRSIDGRD